MFDKNSYRPFPQRSALMSMNTITKEDVPPRRKTYIRSHSNSLRTDDIQGASPRLAGYQFFNKPDPVPLVKRVEVPLKKPFYSLMTSDLEKAQPDLLTLKTNRLGHNPLVPVYKLPSYYAPPPTPPKFIRNVLDVSDIQSSPSKTFPKVARNSLEISDIPGAKPKSGPALNKPSFHCPRDINNGIEEVFYVRDTNPLMPEYKVRNENNEVVTIGPVEGSTPKVFSDFAYKTYPRSLFTEDIDGAATGTVGKSKVVNYVAQPTNTQDIPGAQAGTLIKGIKTARITHPLDPDYAWKTASTPPPVKEISKVEATMADKTYNKNLKKFFDVQSSAASSEPSVRSEGKADNFNINHRQFYGQTPRGTPATERRALRVSAQKFFENGNHRQQSFDFNPGSIHRVKAKKPQQGEGFEADCQRFFAASTTSQRANSSHSQNAPKLSSRASEASNPDYQFAFNRSEIREPSNRSQSTRKSLPENDN